jgi:hypothetical protein
VIEMLRKEVVGIADVVEEVGVESGCKTSSQEK